MAMKTKYYLLLIAISTNALISCIPIATPPLGTNVSPTLTPTPTVTPTPRPTLSPTPVPTATSAYYSSLNMNQQILYDSAPNMDDKGWNKKFLSEPFDNYLGYYDGDEVIAIYDTETKKVFHALQVNNNLFVNEGRSAIVYNPVFSEDEARIIVDNIMLWYRIRLCATQKRAVIPNDLEEVVSSAQFQEYLDNCTVTLRSWTAEKTYSQDRDKGCAPFHYSVSKQTINISRGSGIIIWLNSKRLENKVNICLAQFDRESNPPKIIGYYLGTAVGVHQIDDGPMEISVFGNYGGWDNYRKYILADSLREALRLTSMRVYKTEVSDGSQIDNNFYEIMDRWMINHYGFTTEPPLVYENR
jgi:hypothetical protein